MKLLYFGTICNKENYERMRKGFRVNPSAAPFVFETALLKGFSENGVDLEAVSFPAIPAFPRSRYLAWGHRKEMLESGYRTTWIGAINISGLKQLCQRLSSYTLLRRWLRRNAAEEKAVLIYSAYQPVSKSIVTLCKKYRTKCFAIIPDLPRDMYSVARINPVKKALSGLYVRAAEKVQGCFDGYIYLTRAMKDVINPSAPYTVVEGIANVAELEPPSLERKAPGKVIMYAGALSEKLGLPNLIEAFSKMNVPDAQLWLFGGGDYADAIREYAEKDSRIRYFGFVSRERILRYEKQAALLINVRNTADEFTKYSFPSKTIEYMLSGTPLLTTRLSGIPEEYYDYAYSVENNDVDTLRAAMERICAKPQEELIAFGASAQRFVAQEKNGNAQAAKIMELIIRLVE